MERHLGYLCAVCSTGHQPSIKLFAHGVYFNLFHMGILPKQCSGTQDAQSNSILVRLLKALSVHLTAQILTRLRAIYSHPQIHIVLQKVILYAHYVLLTIYVYTRLTPQSAYLFRAAP
jgi:hypothetical protein